jgi:hypothetical protein
MKIGKFTIEQGTPFDGNAIKVSTEGATYYFTLQTFEAILAAAAFSHISGQHAALDQMQKEMIV